MYIKLLEIIYNIIKLILYKKKMRLGQARACIQAGRTVSPPMLIADKLIEMFDIYIN
jgi:hypothetical protein